jgi:hypothetical protein
VIAVLLSLGRAGRASGCCPSIEAKHIKYTSVQRGSMLGRANFPFVGLFPGEITE